MKKIIPIFLLLSAAGSLVRAQNPIPSFDVPVFPSATFHESSPDRSDPDRSLEKRVIHVVVYGSPSGMANITLYSLDSVTVLGPYVRYGGQSLEQEIDEREWGVSVTSEDEMYVDVWIEEE